MERLRQVRPTPNTSGASDRRFSGPCDGWCNHKKPRAQPRPKKYQRARQNNHMVYRDVGEVFFCQAHTIITTRGSVMICAWLIPWQISPNDFDERIRLGKPFIIEDAGASVAPTQDDLFLAQDRVPCACIVSASPSWLSFRSCLQGENLDLVGSTCQQFHERFPSAKMRAEYSGGRTPIRFYGKCPISLTLSSRLCK